jgi:uncharacterized protein
VSDQSGHTAAALEREPEVKFHPNAIQTFSGEAYDFVDPDPNTVKMVDIAHALSNMCRFAGHVSRFYSVAEHCVRVSEILEAQGHSVFIQQAGVLHDGHEAYVWDCPRPFKPLLGDAFEEFADKADEVIVAAFFPMDTSTKWFHCEEVKTADDMMLIAEAKVLMHHGPEHWAAWQKRYQHVDTPPLDLGSLGWPPYLAKQKFLSRCADLGLDTEGLA